MPPQKVRSIHIHASLLCPSSADRKASSMIHRIEPDTPKRRALRSASPSLGVYGGLVDLRHARLHL